MKKFYVFLFGKSMNYSYLDQGKPLGLKLLRGIIINFPYNNIVCYIKMCNVPNLWS